MPIQLMIINIKYRMSQKSMVLQINYSLIMLQYDTMLHIT